APAFQAGYAGSIPATRSKLLKSLFVLRRIGRLRPLGARGGDVVAQLHVALVAGVFVEAVVVAPLPIAARRPGCGEDHRVVVGRLVDDGVGTGHREPLDETRLGADRRVVGRRRTGRDDVGGRGAGLEVGR